MGVRLGNPLGILTAAALCAGVLTCDAATADDFGNVYIGASFGRVLNSYDTGYVDQQFATQAVAAGDTLGVTGRSVHRFVDGWWGDVGYLFTPYIGLEAAFLHLGEIRYKTTGELNIAGVEDATATSTEVTSHGPALALLGRLPLTEWFEADMRLGDYFGKTGFYNRVELLGQTSAVTAAKTDSSLLASVGGAFTFAGHWSARLDYLRVNKTGDTLSGGKFSVNLLTAGVSFTF